MKIVFFETRTNEEAQLPALLAGHELVFLKDKLTKSTAQLADGAEIVSVFVSSDLHQETLDLLPSVKLIATRSTGFDHIDVAYAKSIGKTVVSVPGYGSNTVAEFAFGLILTLTRHIIAASNQIVEHTDFRLGEFSGFDLFGKTMGIIGTGRIGKNVARIARGFGMEVVLFDAFPSEEYAQSVGAKYVSLDELLAQSDIISLHTPYNPSTHHILNSTNLPKAKKGAILINTARGELIETDALIAALENSTLAGAALDVLEGERKLKEEAATLAGNPTEADLKLLAQNHLLIDLPQVLVTPHIAFYTREAEMEISKMTAENILAFAAGEPKNIISA